MLGAISNEKSYSCGKCVFRLIGPLGVSETSVMLFEKRRDSAVVSDGLNCECGVDSECEPVVRSPGSDVSWLL